jgi:hypothetical protein
MPNACGMVKYVPLIQCDLLKYLLVVEEFSILFVYIYPLVSKMYFRLLLQVSAAVLVVRCVP